MKNNIKNIKTWNKHWIDKHPCADLHDYSQALSANIIISTILSYIVGVTVFIAIVYLASLL